MQTERRTKQTRLFFTPGHGLFYVKVGRKELSQSVQRGPVRPNKVCAKEYIYSWVDTLYTLRLTLYILLSRHFIYSWVDTYVSPHSTHTYLSNRHIRMSSLDTYVCPHMTHTYVPSEQSFYFPQKYSGKSMNSLCMNGLYASHPWVSGRPVCINLTCLERPKSGINEVPQQAGRSKPNPVNLKSISYDRDKIYTINCKLYVREWRSLLSYFDFPYGP